MEVSYIVFKYTTLILLLCYSVSATCSRKATIRDGKAIYTNLTEQTVNTNLSLSYDAKGLQPLFNLAVSFMDTVQPKNFGDVFHGTDIGELFGSEWKKLIVDYEIPIIITIGVGLLFFLLMPIVGCCFCMCRCCDRCGGDMKQSEKKARQHCKVAMMVFFLFTFTVLMLCGVLFMFVTNDRMHEASNNVVSTYDDVIDEAETLANIVKADVLSLTTDQVSCITDLVRDNMKDEHLNKKIGYPLRDYVQKNVSGVLDLALTISTDINNIVALLETVDAKDKSFNTSIETLNNDVTSAKAKLDGMKTDCAKVVVLKKGGICTELDNIKIDISMDFGDRPNIAKYLTKLQEIKGKNLHANIINANKTVNNIPATVITKSNSSLWDIKDLLATKEKFIADQGIKLAKELQEQVDKLKDGEQLNNVRNKIDGDEAKTFEAIRWKVYVALSAVMAFIVFLLFCGLACGSCGYNKDYMPTERSATANCGGNFLMAAVGIMFIFSFIFMIFCVVWFAVGMHFHVACRELKNGALFDNLVVKHLSKDMRNISITDVLNKCRKNYGLYKAVSIIEEKFNVTEKFDVSSLDAINEKIEKDINFDLASETILSSDTEAALDDMKNSAVYSINFKKFHDILNKSIMAKNLSGIVTTLNELAKNVTKLGAPAQAMATKIRGLATDLENVDKNTITSMKQNIVDLKDVVTKLEEQVQPMKGKASDLLVGLIRADKFVKSDTPDYIKERVLVFAKGLVSYVTDGVDHILDQIKVNLGRCKPVANIYDGVVNTFLCDNLVQNSNGFWLALGWCLLFFIPSIILAVKLAKYFRKMDYSTGMDAIVVDHPPYNDKVPQHNPPYTTPGYSHDLRAPPPYTSTQHNNPGYQHA